MKKLLLPLLLLSALSTQARFATTLPFAMATVPHAPYANRFWPTISGYIGGQQMVESYVGDEVTYVYDSDPYFYFTISGPNGTYENVNVYLESADPEIQLQGGFDEVANIWRLKILTPPTSGRAACTIRVANYNWEAYYNIVLITAP